MAGIPQVITPEKATGALAIDRTTLFNGLDGFEADQLTRTNTAGNRRTFTVSTWLKFTKLTEGKWFGASNNALQIMSGGKFAAYFGQSSSLISTRKLQDPNGWYHCVCTVDTTNDTETERIKLFVNGQRITIFDSTSYPSKDAESSVSDNSQTMYIGISHDSTPQQETGAYMSQYYLIDGLALGPEYFGFTDPLTNTWKPKKFRTKGDQKKDTPAVSLTTVNDGTTWSSNVTGNIYGGSAANVFDSDQTDRAEINSTDADTNHFTVSSINSRAASVGVYVSHAGSDIEISINDVVVGTIPVEHITNTKKHFSFTFQERFVNSVKVRRVGSTSGWYLYGVELDGVFMRDSTTTNLDFGANGFYLPFDASAPLGQDLSGKGNDFEPNFGSVDLDKATGALPILNTVSGGRVAAPGTRTDEYANNLVMAIPFLNNANDISADIKGSGSNLSVSTSGSPAADSDPVQWYGSSFNVSTSNYIDEIGTTSTFAFLHQPEAAGTVEGWINVNAINNQGPWFQTSNGTDDIGLMIRQNSSTNVFVQINRGVSGQAISISGDVRITHNKWYHWAFVKSASGYAQFFLNGQPVADKVAISSGAGASNAASTSSTSTHEGRIAKNNGESRGVGANICDYRAYTIQKYAFDTPFIPASANPSILPETPIGVVGGSPLKWFNDKSPCGSVSFDGTGDNLEIADNADFEMGTDDFTIECFIYNQEDTTQSVVTKYGDNVSNRSFWLGTLTSQRPSFYWYNGSNSYNIDGAAGTLPLNKWSHVVAQRTSGDIYLFVDGKVVASNTGANAAKSFNDLSEPVVIGSDSYSGGNDSPFEGILSNVRIVKGTGVYSTSGFTPPTAPLTNVTNTKLLCCKSNLPDGQGLFEVSPGNITTNGNAASSGFNPFNTDKNSNIGADAVYSTFNPLKEKFLNASGGSVTLTHGNLIVQGNGDSSGSNVAGTLGASSGKYYIEYTVLSGPDSNDTCGFGLRKSLHEGTYNGWNQEYFRGSRIRGTNDNGYYADDTTESFSTITEVGDVLGIAFDIEGNYCQVTRNGHVMASSSSAGLSGYTWYPYFASDGGGKVELNCGQKPFKYAPLDDFKPLNNATVRPLNIFSRADKFVGITTYKGTGVSGIRVETGVNADLIVIKQTNTTRHWGWFDTQRGRGRILYPADDSSDSGTTADIDTLLDDGFTYKTDDRGNGDGGDYLVLSWKAGGGNRSAAADSANVGGFYKDGVDMGTAANAGLGGGTITPSAGSVGTRQGFSIIQYSGVGASRRVPHGLSEAPDLIIVKSKNIQSDWTVYHSSLGRNKYLFLNEPDQASTQSNYWGSADVNSTTFGVENNNTGSNNNNIIAYIWHNVAGLQRFGHYEGNNNADGPFIDLGFTPALIWTKSIDSNSKAWEVHWNQGWRFKENPQSQRLILDDTTDGNAYTNHVDFLSNGFKIRNTFSGMNNATETWIYCAWADVPTIDMYGGGANGR
tara:strand:+ start:345 stop:4736 length:4392 start_codon:yes stop_codon:yes gene_type:complete